MLYKRNETMKLIGLQILGTAERKNFYMLQDIMDAYKEEKQEGHNVTVSSMLIDAYSLGIMTGKRLERERKAENNNTAISSCLNELSANSKQVEGAKGGFFEQLGWHPGEHFTDEVLDRAKAIQDNKRR